MSGRLLFSEVSRRWVALRGGHGTGIPTVGGRRDTRSRVLARITILSDHYSGLRFWRWELPGTGGAEGWGEAKRPRN